MGGRAMEKAARGINRAIDFCLLILFLLMFFTGAYSMYDSYLAYGRAKDPSLYRSRPEKKEEWEKTKKLSDDVVAWLRIEDTEIDFPVMQGEDNAEYLNKDPYGQYSLSGSIFLDARNAPDFSDPYNLIYGHHMEKGAMFGALDAFLERGYLAEHSRGVLILRDAEYTIDLFAVLDSDGREPAIFDPVQGKDPLSYAKKHARYHTQYPGNQTGLIALTTCKESDSLGRTVVLGTLEKREGVSRGIPEAERPANTDFQTEPSG